MKSVSAPGSLFVMSRDEFRKWRAEVENWHAPGCTLVVLPDSQYADAMRRLLGIKRDDVPGTDI